MTETIHCQYCRQDRPAHRFAPSIRAGRTGSGGRTCLDCKARAIMYRRSIKGDPALVYLDKLVQIQDKRDERDATIVPEDVRRDHEARIADYARQVEASSQCGDGREWL